MNIAFLFGAGVSIPSDMYSTEELTDKILTGENVFRNYCNGYEVNNQINNPFFEQRYEYVSRIKKLFQVLNNNLGDHYSFINRIITYEDYYYMIDSMHTDENMEYENPVVKYYSDYLFKVHSYLFEPIEENFAPLRLIDLMSEAKNYIKDLIAIYLKKPPKILTQFNIFSDLNDDEEYSKIYIFTLNHDTLLEQYLTGSYIKFADGFVLKDNDIRLWDSNSYNEKINLFKLHGSVNWANYDTADPYEKKVCIYLKPQREFFHPVINLGSFNKLNEYSKGINFDLQYLFAKNLNKCDYIIISGYSFGDKGINSRLINWLYKKRGRKMIIIHKNASELFQHARPAISNIQHWDYKEKTDLIRVIPKWFQEINWREVKEKI